MLAGFMVHIGIVFGISHMIWVWTGQQYVTVGLSLDRSFLHLH